MCYVQLYQSSILLNSILPLFRSVKKKMCSENRGADFNCAVTAYLICAFGFAYVDC